MCSVSTNMALVVSLEDPWPGDFSRFTSFTTTAARQHGFPLRCGISLHANLQKQPQAAHSKLMNTETDTSEMADSVGKESLYVHYLSDSSVHKILGIWCLGSPWSTCSSASTFLLKLINWESILSSSVWVQHPSYVLNIKPGQNLDTVPTSHI